MNQSHGERLHQWLAVASGALLILAFIFGGSSQERGWGTAAVELAALPTLVLVGWLALGAPRGHRIALGVAMLVLAGVAAQLLPLPAWFEGGGDVRRPVQEAWGAAGLGLADSRISMAPWATERGLWSLLPATAAFGAGLLLRVRHKVQLSWLVTGVICASLLLGLFLLGAPKDSPLNIYPGFTPRMGGLLANPNHQGTALVIAFSVVVSWLLGTLDKAQPSSRAGFSRVPMVWRRAGALLLAALLLVAVPLTGSRAMVLIGAGAMLLLPLTTGWLRSQVRRGRSALALAIVSAGVLAATSLLSAVANWMQVDSALESRGALRLATAALAVDAMPAGTGVGAFSPWFDAHLPISLLQHNFFNHAHNEYVQWWLESGVAGLVWIALLIATMAWAFPRAAIRAFRRPESPARLGGAGRTDGIPNVVGGWLTGAAWLAVAVLLVHSWVDYPLRTPALLTVGAWFAGVLVAGTLQRQAAISPGARGGRRSSPS